MKRNLCLIVVLCFSIFSFAQTQNTPQKETLSLDKGNIESQFDYIIKKSNKFQDYKVVKKAWIEKLKRNVSDSLTAVEQLLDKEIATVASQKEEIATLKDTINTVNANVTNLTEEKDNISLLGIGFSKPTYKLLMWSIIGVLTALLFLFIFRFNSSNKITREVKAKLAETEHEFEEHRKRALEREQKVMRKLQDEINKNKGV